MSNKIELAAPIRVSPFIRACRWTFLGVGIIYGALWQRRLKKKEDALREYEAKIRPELEARIAAEKKRLNREQMLELARTVGVPIPPDFDEHY